MNKLIKYNVMRRLWEWDVTPMILTSAAYRFCGQLHDHAALSQYPLYGKLRPFENYGDEKRLLLLAGIEPSPASKSSRLIKGNNNSLLQTYYYVFGIRPMNAILKIMKHNPLRKS
jgi:hypothetical protein